MGVKGLDISYYQANINFNAIKDAGCEFVILRAGYTGTTYGTQKVKDTSFEDFYNKAKAVGLGVGAYWYSCANDYDKGVAEAQYMIDNCLRGKQFEYPIYMDVEENKWQQVGKDAVGNAIRGFCETLEANGYYAGVYANPNYLNNYINTDMIADYDLWLAQWTSVKPNLFRGYGMWQDSDNGYVAGMRVDTDVAFLDYPSIIKGAGLNGYGNGTPAAAPEPAPVVYNKSIDEIAQEVINGDWGNGDDRYNNLTNAGYNAQEVQDRVNAILSPAPQLKSLDEVANEVIDGIWGNGDDRYNRLAEAGYNPMDVQARVNELMGANGNSLDDVARAVINGDYGNGRARKKALEKAGYNYDEVQRRVNELM